jgi:hypothetical protein
MADVRFNPPASSTPAAHETPALVVAIAWAPAVSIARADPASQAFGKTNGGRSCNSRNRRANSVFTDVLLRSDCNRSSLAAAPTSGLAGFGQLHSYHYVGRYVSLTKILE